MRVVVTGASGTLGSAVTPRLVAAGHQVVATSRSERSATDVEWRRADLTTGTGLADALSGADAVVHLASMPFPPHRSRRVDVEGTWRLGAAAREAGATHLLHVSIVGIDRVPYAYYRAKQAAEEATRGSGVPWSILRATQFFQLADMALSGLARLPVMPIDRALVGQPVDPRDVAGVIESRLAAGPLSGLEEYGGPERMRSGDLTQQWLDARHLRRRLVGMRMPGAFGSAVRAGHLTTDAEPTGSITWQQWLDETYG